MGGFLKKLKSWLTGEITYSTLDPALFLDLDEAGIRCLRRSGARELLAWNRITRVLILTTDSGPFSQDVFFVIEAGDFRVDVAQGAKSSDAVFRKLQDLPGFKHETALEAMGCTETRVFHCWPP